MPTSRYLSFTYTYISQSRLRCFLSLSSSDFGDLATLRDKRLCEILGSVAVRANVAGPTGGGTNVRPFDHGRAQTGQCHCQQIVGEGP